MNVSGIGPGGKPGDGIELAENLAHDFIGIAFGAEAIDFCHHLGERPFDVGDGALGVELALPLQATLTFHKFFPVEIQQGMYNRIALRTRIGQEA
jgi:hypothetical protein